MDRRVLREGKTIKYSVCKLQHHTGFKTALLFSVNLSLCNAFCILFDSSTRQTLTVLYSFRYMAIKKNNIHIRHRTGECPRRWAPVLPWTAWMRTTILNVKVMTHSWEGSSCVPEKHGPDCVCRQDTANKADMAKKDLPVIQKGFYNSAPKTCIFYTIPFTLCIIEHIMCNAHSPQHVPGTVRRIPHIRPLTLR